MRVVFLFHHSFSFPCSVFSSCFCFAFILFSFFISFSLHIKTIINMFKILLIFLFIFFFSGKGERCGSTRDAFIRKVSFVGSPSSPPPFDCNVLRQCLAGGDAYSRNAWHCWFHSNLQLPPCVLTNGVICFTTSSGDISSYDKL